MIFLEHTYKSSLILGLMRECLCIVTSMWYVAARHGCSSVGLCNRVEALPLQENWQIRRIVASYGNGSNTHEIKFGYRFLPYFNSNADTNILEYRCKMDTMDSDSHSDIYSIQRETNITKFDETNKILVPRSSIAKANQNQIIHLIIFQVIVN